MRHAAQVANECSDKLGQKMNLNIGMNLAGFYMDSHIYKSLITTFGKHTVTMTNKPKVRIKLL